MSGPPRAALLATFVGLLLTIACGSNRPTYSDQPVDFAYRSEGADYRLAELRGRPLVLVLIRTAELTSEIYLREVRRAYTQVAGRTRLLVLSLEPSEEPLVGPYVEFHELPFSIGTAEFAVAAGQTGLGTIPLVPSTYFIDHHGLVRELAPGAISAEEIAAAVARQRWE